MAGKSNYTAEMLLNLVYKGSVDAALASAAGSATQIYFALHTADPGDAGTQATNEVTAAQFPTYTRAAVARGAGFGDVSTVGGTSKIKPAATINFPATDNAGTGCVITHFSTGLAASGETVILHSGTISPSITLPAGQAGIIPQLTSSTEISES